MTESAAATLTEVTTLAATARANQSCPPDDAPLIRVTVSGRPDPVTAAIARHITRSGSVFLELPDGQLTVVLRLDGQGRIRRRRDDGIRR